MLVMTRGPGQQVGEPDDDDDADGRRDPTYGDALPDRDAGDDDGWNRVGILFDTLREPELLGLSAADVVHRLFHEESPAWLGDKPLRFACSCSRDRVAAMLVSLGRGEADAAVEAGGGEAQVRCEFCGQQYRFDAAAIAELFHDATREMPAAAGLQ